MQFFNLLLSPMDEFSDIETNGPKEQLFPIIEFFSINTGLLILKVLELFDSVKFEFNKNSKPDFSPVIVPISMNFLHWIWFTIKLFLIMWLIIWGISYSPLDENSSLSTASKKTFVLKIHAAKIF